LPALIVDGPYVKRSDTMVPVWLKGLVIEEFRQSRRNTFADVWRNFTHNLLLTPTANVLLDDLSRHAP
jgi:hypothetical protein